MAVVHDDSAFNYLLDRARAITAKAEADNDRDVTPAEKAEVNGLLDKAQLIKDAYERRERMAGGPRTSEQEKDLRDQVERIQGSFNGPLGGGGGFAKTILDAGFNLKHQPSVKVSLASALGAKANVFPADLDWNRTEPVVVQMGRDSRWLYPNLVIADAGDAASIQDFRQTARTLTGTVKRDLDATTDKANVDVTLAIINEALSQFAVTIDDIPNALFESVDQLRAFLDSEARFQIDKALDADVFAQIVAASPPFGNTGTGLPAQIRNGVSAMRSEGADPELVVLNSADAATLDLFEDTAGNLVFATRDTGSSSPIWNLRVVERASAAGNEPPYLIDPQMLGVLYLGRMDFAVDPFTGFKANLSTLRAETKALYHVRNAKGARRIAAA